jgi:hypothetical protein
MSKEYIIRDATVRDVIFVVMGGGKLPPDSRFHIGIGGTK